MFRRFEISLATFDLQPPSLVLELKKSVGTVEQSIQKILRVKESSLDPLYR